MAKFGFTARKKEQSSTGFEEADFLPPKCPYQLRLKELRIKARMNQTEAGQIVSTSQKQYSRWETGAFEIPVFELTVFAIYFNRRVDYILGLSDDDSPLFTVEEQRKRIEAMKISGYFNRFGMWDAFGVPSGKAVMDNWKKRN